jgi:metal-responsive CopG/Arc/MetJ family transcriptional regulator
VKHHIGLTIDAALLRDIERIRGREKRSTFMEHLIKLGLKAYKNENHVILTDQKELDPQGVRNHADESLSNNS